MAKSKNHTNHNQNRKAHRNGIKKVPRPLKVKDTKGQCPKYKRNLKNSRAALRNSGSDSSSSAGSE